MSQEIDFQLESISDGSSDARRQAIRQSDYLDALRHSYAYGGVWAVDKTQKAVVYFSGKDTLDPCIPMSFVLLTEKCKICFDVLHGASARETGYESLNDVYFLVIKWSTDPGLSSQDSIKHLVVCGVRTLLRCNNSEYIFLPKFNQISNDISYQPAKLLRPKFSDYILALKPVVVLLIFGLAVLALSSVKR